MNKCRICLQKKIKLLCVNETDQGVTYASMISSISCVKNLNPGIDMICISCRKKLRDSYEFKLLIERSDLELNGLLRVYKFNTIEDVEFLMQIDKKPLINDFDFNNILQNGSDSGYYNNTLIKRLYKEEKFESIKSEIDEDDSLEFSDRDINLQEDEDYHPQKKIKKKVKKKKTICIKPVLIKDLKPIAFRSKHRNKKQRLKREDHTICPYCGKIVKCIKNHIIQHEAERNFSCDHCKKSFYTKKRLEYHMKYHFSNLKLKCSLCIAVFNNKGTLARHVASHSDIKQFTCKVCDKAFKRRGAMNRHMLTHSLVKPFKCDQCPMLFNTKYNLRHHYRVHTGERPYKCELCSQPYSYKRDFNRHCLNKHGVFVDRRPVYIMNEEVLKEEKALMKDLMLQLHGIRTEKEPLECFQVPQGSKALAKVVQLLESKKLIIDVHL